jgi:hypothetical protein
VSGRNKELDAETTGAFGIGFTAVYQVTDRPSLLFNGQHLLVDDSAREDERLEFCGGGCGLQHDREGTTLVLPWATQDSQLRRLLQVEHLSETDIQMLLKDMHLAVPEALLFLRSVRKIVIEDVGRRTEAVRHDTPEGVEITTNGAKVSWLVLAGRSQDAADLRRRYRQIGERRDVVVRIALPLQGTVNGRIYATLPTEAGTGWSGHIDATFYPRQDRKGVEFDSNNYRSRWNEALIQAAAKIMAAHLERLATSVGAAAVWRYLLQAESISKQVATASYPPAFAAFATQARLTAGKARIALTTQGELLAPNQCLVCLEDDDYAAAATLSRLGQPLLHPTLRADALQVSGEYAPERLTLRHLVRILVSAGVTEPWRPPSGPVSLEENRTLLALVHRLQKRAAAQFEDSGIAEVALVPCVDGTIAPAALAWALTDDERALFELLDPELSVLDKERLEADCTSLVALCPPMTTPRAVKLFAQNPDNLAVAPQEVLEWLSERPADLNDAELRELVRALPIFPTAEGERRPLTELSLPSAFEDPLGIAALVDRRQVQGLEDFLKRTLNCKELDLVDYLETHLIPASHAGTVLPERLADVLNLISRERLKLEAEDRLRNALSEAPLVRCTDGVVRPAQEVHVASDLVSRLDPATPLVAFDGQPTILAETLAWLGVHETPSPALISQVAVRLAEDKEDPAVEVALAILESLTKPLPPSVPPDLQDLISVPWMPVEGGGRGIPPSLYASFRLEAFESQGPRVGLPRNRQSDLSDQMQWLGVNPNPTTAMVVAHLRHCVENGRPAHELVFQVLSEPRSDVDTIRRLRSEPCVQVSAGVFAPPSSVFWSANGLGSRAHVLTPEHNRYRPFFDLVGVAERPAAEHLELILREIGRETGSDTVSPEDELVVQRCWEVLDDLLDDSETSDETRDALMSLGQVRCFVDPRGMLEAPTRLRFMDGRRLAERFELLRNNVIRRRYAVRALSAAGVGRAEDDIETVLERDALREPSQLAGVVAQRLPAIRRLLASADRDPSAVDMLTGLSFLRTPGLTVSYVARFAHQEEHKGPFHEDALYLPHEATVLSSSESVTRPFARELMRCLSPDAEDSTMASSLFEVLQAESIADAMSLLDEYGVPDHEHAEPQLAPTLEAAAPDSSVTEPAELHGVTANTYEGGPIPRSTGDSGPGAPAADAAGSGDDSKSRDTPTSAQDGLAPTKDGAGGSARSRGSTAAGGSAKLRHRQSRLVSYVILGDGDDRQEESLGDASRRESVDRAGVLRVLAFERSCGRTPEEQDHGNPGFDVVSRDTAGNIVRRIEIKSTGSAWEDFSIAMSRTQLEENRERGAEFWLYVVENAEDDDAFRIHRIQDPWAQASKFAFDPGWQAVSEPDLERDDTGAPLVRATRQLLGWGSADKAPPRPSDGM